MKPTFITTRSEKRFPLIECNYHSMTLSGYRAVAQNRRHLLFATLAVSYFQREARHDFFGEAVLFSILVVAATVPMVSGATPSFNSVALLGAL